MPEGFEQNRSTNPHSVHALGPVNFSVDAWTSRAGTLYVGVFYRLEAQVWIYTLPCTMFNYRQNPTPFAGSTLTVDNASNQTLQQMSGMRCLAHLVNLQARDQGHQLREQANVSHRLRLSNRDPFPTEPHGKSSADRLSWEERFGHHLCCAETVKILSNEILLETREFVWILKNKYLRTTSLSLHKMWQKTGLSDAQTMQVLPCHGYETIFLKNNP
jgi:hypothetical protein